MATTKPPSFIHPASDVKSAASGSSPQAASLPREQSSPREVLDLTVSDDQPYPGTTSASGSTPAHARIPAIGLISGSPPIAFGKAGTSGRGASSHRPFARQMSSSPTQSPTPSSATASRASSSPAPRGRGRGKPPARPHGGRNSAEQHEAEKAARRARYVPKARGPPKTAMFLNPDYNAYSHLKERPLGISPFEKDEFGRTIIRKNELFCRVKNEVTGELCRHTARLSGTGAVTSHVKSGKHNLPIAPMAFLGNVADERADNAKFYKDVMARHRELGGPEPVYSEEERQRSLTPQPAVFDPVAGDYLPDRPGGAGQMPGFFPGAAARETAPARVNTPSDQAQGAPAAAPGAADNPPPYAAHGSAAIQFQGAQLLHHGVKRKRTEAERELRNVRKELKRTDELRQEAEAEVRQLREEHDALLVKLRQYEPEVKRRKNWRKGDDVEDSDDEGGDRKEHGVKVEVKTEEDVKIKQENEEEISITSKGPHAQGRSKTPVKHSNPVETYGTAKTSAATDTEADPHIHSEALARDTTSPADPEVQGLPGGADLENTAQTSKLAAKDATHEGFDGMARNVDGKIETEGVVHDVRDVTVSRGNLSANRLL